MLRLYARLLQPPGFYFTSSSSTPSLSSFILKRKMPVRMRLAMHGRRNARIFHLVVAQSTKARDAKPIETLGIFSPRLKPDVRTKTVEWSVDRINYWLGVGAEPSKAAVRLLTLVCDVPCNIEGC